MNLVSPISRTKTPEAPAPRALTPPEARVKALYRHPVKGLSPERVETVSLQAGGYFPQDRIYAVENGDSGFDPEKPAFRPKTAYLMLMRHARLAALDTRFDDATTTLTLRRNGAELARGDLSTAQGAATIADFLTGYMGMEATGPLRVLAAPAGFRFVDSAKSGFVSLLNLATVRELGTVMGRDIDPLRFRMNVHLDGWPANAELDLVGRAISIGTARLTIIKRTVRCPATQVNPDTAERDMDIQQGLRNAWGHMDCGVYARVDQAGSIQPGDGVTLCDTQTGD